MPEKLSLREIDVLVAEKVMGHAVGRLERLPKDQQSDDCFTFYRNTATGNTVSGLSFRNGDPMQGDGKLSHYSTDIAAAWKVVEKMNAIAKADDYKGCVFYEQLRRMATATRSCPIVGLLEAVDFRVTVCVAALAAHGIDVEVREEVGNG